MLNKNVFTKTLFIGVLFFTLQFCFSNRLIQATPDVYLYGQEAYSMFVITGDGVVVIDPINDFQARELDGVIKGITNQPVKYVFYSHNHWDHIAGGNIFKNQGAEIMAHSENAAHLKANPSVPAPDLAWTGSYSNMKVGSKTFEFHHFGPSHGKGMTVFTIPEDRVMFTADLVVPNRVGFMHMPDFEFEGWLNTLDQMLLLDYDFALFAHTGFPDGNPVGTKANVEAQRQFLADLIGGVKQGFASGSMMAAFGVQLPQYSHWAGYDAWMGMNAAAVALQLGMGYTIY